MGRMSFSNTGGPAAGAAANSSQPITTEIWQRCLRTSFCSIFIAAYSRLHHDVAPERFASVSSRLSDVANQGCYVWDICIRVVNEECQIIAVRRSEERRVGK